jgi:predicted outer membrane protein
MSTNTTSTHAKRGGLPRALAALAAAGALAAGLAVDAQTPAPGPNGPPPMNGPGMDLDAQLPASDADFVRALDRANNAELDMAKYVVNRTKSPEVHQFAQRMIDDHSTASVQLSAVTRGTNLFPAPSASPGPMGGRMMMMLQSETGTQLDNDYMRVQVPMHRRALGLLQWESQNGQNTGLKTLATNLAPTVQQHLQIAQSYLAAHNLTPFSPPPPNPVPGHPNPPGSGGTPNGTTPNNPASGPANGGTSGQNAPSPVNPVPGATPTVPLGTGTAAPLPSPMPSSSPRS